jgi:hypothetical protein
VHRFDFSKQHDAYEKRTGWKAIDDWATSVKDRRHIYSLATLPTFIENHIGRDCMYIRPSFTRSVLFALSRQTEFSLLKGTISVHVVCAIQPA